MANGHLVCFGLDALDPRVHGGQFAIPDGVADARTFRSLMEPRGFSGPDPIENERVTRQRFISEIRSAASHAAPGDTLLIYFAGHGGRARFRDAREEGHGFSPRAHFILVYDGWLSDFELHFLLAGLPPHLRVVFVADACRSSAMPDLLERHPRPATLPQANVALPTRTFFLTGADPQPGLPAQFVSRPWTDALAAEGAEALEAEPTKLFEIAAERSPSYETTDAIREVPQFFMELALHRARLRPVKRDSVVIEPTTGPAPHTVFIATADGFAYGRVFTSALASWLEPIGHGGSYAEMIEGLAGPLLSQAGPILFSTPGSTGAHDEAFTPHPTEPT